MKKKTKKIRNLLKKKFGKVTTREVDTDNVRGPNYQAWVRLKDVPHQLEEISVIIWGDEPYLNVWLYNTKPRDWSATKKETAKSALKVAKYLNEKLDTQIKIVWSDSNPSWSDKDAVKELKKVLGDITEKSITEELGIGL